MESAYKRLNNLNLLNNLKSIFAFLSCYEKSDLNMDEIKTNKKLNEKREKKTKSPSCLIDTTNNVNSFSHLSCLKSKENIFGIKIDIQCSIHSVPKKSRRL